MEPRHLNEFRFVCNYVLGVCVSGLSLFLIVCVLHQCLCFQTGSARVADGSFEQEFEGDMLDGAAAGAKASEKDAAVASSKGGSLHPRRASGRFASRTARTPATPRM